MPCTLVRETDESFREERAGVYAVGTSVRMSVHACVRDLGGQ